MKQICSVTRSTALSDNHGLIHGPGHGYVVGGVSGIHEHVYTVYVCVYKEYVICKMKYTQVPSRVYPHLEISVPRMDVCCSGSTMNQIMVTKKKG